MFSKRCVEFAERSAARIEAAIVLGEPVWVFGRGLGRLGLRLGRALVAGFYPLQQRIALDFLVDEPVELEMRQLQQPDRLHQLRRHHQGLRLAQL